MMPGNLHKNYGEDWDLKSAKETHCVSLMPNFLSKANCCQALWIIL